jgi:hypothetical protein
MNTAISLLSFLPSGQLEEMAAGLSGGAKAAV